MKPHESPRINKKSIRGDSGDSWPVWNRGINSHRIIKGQAKVLIRLRVCAGWSEPLLVAHTTMLEISCHGLNYIIEFYRGIQKYSHFCDI